MEIKIEINAASVEEVKQALSEFLSGTGATLSVTAIAEPAAEKPKATRKAAEPAKEAVVAPINADPLASAPVSADPLATAPAPTADPLASTVPAKQTLVTLASVREAISVKNNKQNVKDLIAKYLKADGSACEKPSDVQEKDYAAVLEALDYIN